MPKPEKIERRSPAQIAYDEANAAYQKAWREDEAFRHKANEAAVAMLDADQCRFDEMMERCTKFVWARGILRQREAKTAKLLVAREEAYRALTSSPS